MEFWLLPPVFSKLCEVGRIIPAIPLHLVHELTVCFSLPPPGQAPSASLCIAILSLHRDSTACGHQLIEHCCRLSQGLSNPEVDAGLLTDIMKQLLFSAKMMFVKAGQSQDLALCDR